MNKFIEMQNDLKRLVDVSYRMGMHNQMLLQFNNMNSKDFDQEKCDKIQEKINEFTKIYISIYFKYF